MIRSGALENKEGEVGGGKFWISLIGFIIIRPDGGSRACTLGAPGG